MSHPLLRETNLTILAVPLSAAEISAAEILSVIQPDTISPRPDEMAFRIFPFVANLLVGLVPSFVFGGARDDCIAAVDGL